MGNTSGEQSGRPALDRVAVRAPWLPGPGFRFVRLLPSGSRLRRRLVWWLVRRGVAAVNRGDLDAALAIAYEPDVRIRPIGFALDWPELYTGHDGMRDFFAQWTDAMGWPHFIVEKMADLGDRLVLDVTFASAGRLSGAEILQRSGFIVALSPRGRVSGWDMYWDRAEAHAAAGLTG